MTMENVTLVLVAVMEMEEPEPGELQPHAIINLEKPHPLPLVPFPGLGIDLPSDQPNRSMRFTVDEVVVREGRIFALQHPQPDEVSDDAELAQWRLLGFTEV